MWYRLWGRFIKINTMLLTLCNKRWHLNIAFSLVFLLITLHTLCCSLLFLVNTFCSSPVCYGCGPTQFTISWPWHLLWHFVKNEHLGEIKDFSQNFSAFLFINEGFFSDFRQYISMLTLLFAACLIQYTVNWKLAGMLVTQGLYICW